MNVSGEVTIALLDWWKTGRALHTQEASGPAEARPRRKPNPYTPPSIAPAAVPPRLLAADPVSCKTFSVHLASDNFVVHRRSISSPNATPILLDTFVQGSCIRVVTGKVHCTGESGHGRIAVDCI